MDMRQSSKVPSTDARFSIWQQRIHPKGIVAAKPGTSPVSPFAGVWKGPHDGTHARVSGAGQTAMVHAGREQLPACGESRVCRILWGLFKPLVSQQTLVELLRFSECYQAIPSRPTGSQNDFSLAGRLCKGVKSTALHCNLMSRWPKSEPPQKANCLAQLGWAILRDTWGHSRLPTRHIINQA